MKCPYCGAKIESTLKKAVCLTCYEWVELSTALVEDELDVSEQEIQSFEETTEVPMISEVAEENVLHENEIIEKIMTEDETDAAAGIEYSVEGETAVVSAYHGSEEKVKIPETYGKYPVSKIGKGAFSRCMFLKEVEIANSVTEIEKDAFHMCLELQRVCLGKGILRIGEGAFYKCTALEEVVYPVKPKKVAATAFAGCPNLAPEIKNHLCLEE